MFGNDIQRRVDRDFGAAAQLVTQQLETFIESFRAVAHTHPGDRVIRCIVHLANGNLDDLAHYIRAALADPRDVMFWAENDATEKQIHDFNLRFPDVV
jgi:hypothetical protein